VRRLVGVLVEIGKGALPPSAAATLLHDPKGIPPALTAPPSGLFLARVVYPGESRGDIPRPPIALPASR
jgi:tRNA pseudouridine38-40 synthase